MAMNAVLTSTNTTAYSDRLMAGHLLPRAVSSHHYQASYSLSVWFLLLWLGLVSCGSCRRQ